MVPRIKKKKSEPTFQITLREKNSVVFSEMGCTGRKEIWAKTKREKKLKNFRKQLVVTEL